MRSKIFHKTQEKINKKQFWIMLDLLNNKKNIFDGWLYNIKCVWQKMFALLKLSSR